MKIKINLVGNVNAGHYNPHKKEAVINLNIMNNYVVGEDDLIDFFSITLTHELIHALQDELTPKALYDYVPTKFGIITKKQIRIEYITNLLLIDCTFKEFSKAFHETTITFCKWLLLKYETKRLKQRLTYLSRQQPSTTPTAH